MSGIAATLSAAAIAGYNAEASSTTTRYCGRFFATVAGSASATTVATSVCCKLELESYVWLKTYFHKIHLNGKYIFKSLYTLFQHWRYPLSSQLTSTTMSIARPTTPEKFVRCTLIKQLQQQVEEEYLDFLCAMHKLMRNYNTYSISIYF